MNCICESRKLFSTVSQKENYQKKKCFMLERGKTVDRKSPLLGQTNNSITFISKSKYLKAFSAPHRPNFNYFSCLIKLPVQHKSLSPFVSCMCVTKKNPMLKAKKLSVVHINFKLFSTLLYESSH